MVFTCKGQETTLNCQGLKENVCPTQNVDGAGNVSLKSHNPSRGNTYGGCYSPCGLLTYSNWGNPYGRHAPANPPADKYCCAGAYNTNPTCMRGPDKDMEYTKVVHSHCDAYAWAYDDAVGLKACPSSTTQFHITFMAP